MKSTILKGSIFVGVVSILIFSIFNIKESLKPVRYVWSLGRPSIYTPEIEECLQDLWKIKEAIEKFKYTQHRLPQSLEELVPQYINEEYLISPGGKRYTYIIKKNTYFVIYPDSKRLGVKLIGLTESKGVPQIIS